jgi:hypothetical protein
MAAFSKKEGVIIEKYVRIIPLYVGNTSKIKENTARVCMNINYN